MIAWWGWDHKESKRLLTGTVPVSNSLLLTLTDLLVVIDVIVVVVAHPHTYRVSHKIVF